MPDASTVDEMSATPQEIRQVTTAAAVGTFVEWFDFAVYGFFATTIAAKFFPSGDSTVGLLQTFAVFAVAFAMRPLGGIVFGSLGDRVGRRAVLALTVILMSSSTGLIGLLPSYDSIGYAAPALLALARCAQGASAGGEYAGACTFLIEHVSRDHRARTASWLPAATFAAFAGAASFAFVLELLIPETAMAQWGWRIPFLIAIPLGLVGFFIRRRLNESPVFQDLGSDAREHSPLREAFATHASVMLRVGGFIMLTALSFYLFSTYMTTFLKVTVGMDSEVVLATNVLALLAAVAAAPPIGRLCDRIGRRRTMFIAAGALALLTVPGYLLASTGSFSGALIGQLLIAAGAVTANVVTAVLLSEMFPTHVRFTASAVTYNGAYALFGGTAPFVATWLVAATGNRLSPAIYLTVIAVLAFAAAATLPESAGRSLSLDTTSTDPEHATTAGQ